MALVGVIVLGAGVGLGIHELFPVLPLSLCLIGVGLLLAGGGAVLVIYGKEKTEEKVEKTLTVEHQTQQHPMAATVIAVVAGLALYRLFRGWRERRPAPVAAPTTVSSDGFAAAEAKAEKPGLLASLADQVGNTVLNL